MKIITSLIVILLTAHPAMAASYKLDIKDNKPFYQTNIPLDIYKQTHSSNLQDLTITNATGEQVPYALMPYEELHPETTNRKETINLQFAPIKINALQNSNNMQLALEKSAAATSINITTYDTKPSDAKPATSTVFLIDLGTKYPPINELLVDWQGGENTLHNIQVLTSTDLKNWVFAGDATLVNSTSANAISQHAIQLNNNWNSSNNARYLQIRPADANDTGTVTITQVQARYDILQTVEATALWQAPRFIARESDDKAGLINIDFESFGHYPASRLKVWLPQANTITYATIFVRNATNQPWKQVGYRELHRHKESEPFSSISNMLAIDARYWRLQFNQAQGGIGAETPALHLGWLAPTVVWNARGQAPFTLAVGENPNIVNTIPISSMLPKYDAQTINKLPAANLIITKQAAQDAQTASTWVAPHDYKTWLLWGGLALGVLLLAGMAYSLLKSERKN